MRKRPVGPSARRPVGEEKKSRDIDDKKNMPLAGQADADRARAHLGWAERYNRHDERHKAAAHFGRALEYDRRSAAKSQEFGGKKSRVEQVDKVDISSLHDLQDRANEAFKKQLVIVHHDTATLSLSIEEERALKKDTRRSEFSLPPLTVYGKNVEYEIVATGPDEPFGARVVWLGNPNPEDLEKLHEALAELERSPDHGQQFVLAVIKRLAVDFSKRYQKSDTLNRFRLGLFDTSLSAEHIRKVKAANPTDQAPLLTSYALCAFVALTLDHINAGAPKAPRKRKAPLKAPVPVSPPVSPKAPLKPPRKRKAPVSPPSPPVSIIVPGPNAGPMRIHVTPAGVEAMLVYSVRWGGGKYAAPYNPALALASARANLSALLDTMERQGAKPKEPKRGPFWVEP
jgi:hypothetical protein